MSRKAYAVRNIAFDSKSGDIDISRLKTNIKTVKEMLFVGLTYQTSDMLVEHKAPLVNIFISALFLFGLVLMEQTV